MNTDNLFKNINDALISVNIKYPNFNEWLNKVFNETKDIDNLERDIILRVDTESNKIAGILILKSNIEENKICTLVVLPEYRKQGIASELMSFALNFAKGDINLTVSENKIEDFKPLFYKFGFEVIKEEYIYKYIYNSQHKEIFFSKKIK